VQTTGLLPVHVPLWHESLCVHAFPSLHVVPLARAGFEQAPLVGLHVPTPWHWSLAVQTTGLLPVQTPLWHESLKVHALPSLQAVPFEAAGFVHAPVTGLQAPTEWHWSCAVQTTGLPPTHVPL
jgi:hypothetical protein